VVDVSSHCRPRTEEAEESGVRRIERGLVAPGIWSSFPSIVSSLVGLHLVTLPLGYFGIKYKMCWHIIKHPGVPSHLRFIFSDSEKRDQVQRAQKRGLLKLRTLCKSYFDGGCDSRHGPPTMNNHDNKGINERGVSQSCKDSSPHIFYQICGLLLLIQRMEMQGL
jgi:hypothetical protein